MGNCLLHVQVAEFQPPDTVKKLFHSCFSSILYKTRSSHSKAFIYLNPWKLSVKKLICNEVARCQSPSVRKKLFHTSSFMYFAFIFSEYITITSSEDGLKVVLLVIYLFNHNSSKSTFFMLNMAFGVLLSTVFVK